MKTIMPFTCLNINTGESSVEQLQESNDYLGKLFGRLIVGGGGHIPGMPRWSVLIRIHEEYAKIDIGYSSQLMATSGVIAWQKKHALAAWNHTADMFAKFEGRPNDPKFINSMPDMPEFAPWLVIYTHQEIQDAVCPAHLNWIQPFCKLLSSEIINMAFMKMVQTDHHVSQSTQYHN